MKRASRRAGAILSELLVAGVIMLLVGSALIMAVQSSYMSRDVILGQNTATAAARQPIDTLADHVRNAQLYTPGGLTTRALSSATASDITYYANSAGDTVRYWRDTTTSPAALSKTVTVGGTATTTTVLTGLDSLTFTYYISSAGLYQAPTNLWVTTANPNAPTSDELALVGAINIQASVTIDGYSRQYSSFVRLRNSPPKSGL